ncbi:MAG: hypothetical protein LBE50_02800, partial [Gallionellaceae bacterium]|nr:hypothetical protein [Gallionellaceae bacterium]
FPVIPAQAGIQFVKQFRRSRTIRFCPLRGLFIFNWIPACAGMTGIKTEQIENFKLRHYRMTAEFGVMCKTL